MITEKAIIKKLAQKYASQLGDAVVVWDRYIFLPHKGKVFIPESGKIKEYERAITSTEALKKLIRWALKRSNSVKDFEKNLNRISSFFSDYFFSKHTKKLYEMLHKYERLFSADYPSQSSYSRLMREAKREECQKAAKKVLPYIKQHIHDMQTRPRKFYLLHFLSKGEPYLTNRIESFSYEENKFFDLLPAKLNPLITATKIANKADFLEYYKYFKDRHPDCDSYSEFRNILDFYFTDHAKYVLVQLHLYADNIIKTRRRERVFTKAHNVKTLLLIQQGEKITVVPFKHLRKWKKVECLEPFIS